MGLGLFPRLAAGLANSLKCNLTQCVKQKEMKHG